MGWTSRDGCKLSVVEGLGEEVEKRTMGAEKVGCSLEVWAGGGADY